MPKPTKRDPYPFAKTVGATFREERDRQKLSDIKFAKASGISRRHLGELQKGANATLMVAFKAMRALGLSELSHDFEGETLTLRLPGTPASIQAATLVDVAEEMEQAAALLRNCATALLGVTAHIARDPSVAANAPLAVKATALIDEFGALCQQLDAESKTDILQRLAHVSSAPSPPVHAADQPKRKSKTG